MNKLAVNTGLHARLDAAASAVATSAEAAIKSALETHRRNQAAARAPRPLPAPLTKAEAQQFAKLVLDSRASKIQAAALVLAQRLPPDAGTIAELIDKEVTHLMATTPKMSFDSALSAAICNVRVRIVAGY